MKGCSSRRQVSNTYTSTRRVPISLIRIGFGLVGLVRLGLVFRFGCWRSVGFGSGLVWFDAIGSRGCGRVWDAHDAQPQTNLPTNHIHTDVYNLSLTLGARRVGHAGLGGLDVPVRVLVPQKLVDLLARVPLFAYFFGGGCRLVTVWVLGGVVLRGLGLVDVLANLLYMFIYLRTMSYPSSPEVTLSTRSWASEMM